MLQKKSRVLSISTLSVRGTATPAGSHSSCRIRIACRPHSHRGLRHVVRPSPIHLHAHDQLQARQHGACLLQGHLVHNHLHACEVYGASKIRHLNCGISAFASRGQPAKHSPACPLLCPWPSCHDPPSARQPWSWPWPWLEEPPQALPLASSSSQPWATRQQPPMQQWQLDAHLRGSALPPVPRQQVQVSGRGPLEAKHSNLNGHQWQFTIET